MNPVGPDTQACPFCHISVKRNDPAKCDTILWQSRDLLLVPTVGPLVVGHVMLIPKRHGTGSLSEPPGIQSHLRIALSRVLQICTELGQPALYGEHGEGELIGQPCISHTHIHILPGLSYLVEELASLLPPMPAGASTSYIIYGREDLELQLDASSTKSQYLRRVIAQAIGVETWDYAAFPNDAFLDQTIEYWEAVL